jgi:hypothetical protein
MRVVYQYIKKRVQEALKGTTRFLRRKPEQKKKTTEYENSIRAAGSKATTTSFINSSF